MIKNVLKDNPRGLSVTDISKKIGINRNTVAKYLEILRISGHIEMESIGTAKIYYLSQKIPISTLLNFTSDNILVIDSEHKVVQANERFADMLGIPKKELSGRPIEELITPMMSTRTFIEKIDEGIKGKELVEILDLIIKNELRFFKTKIIPSTFDDGESSVTVIMENITENMNSLNYLKEEQEKLEILVSERTSELKKSNELLKKEITERKVAEERILEEHAKAQNYLDVAGVLIMVLDKDKNCTLINRKGLGILECDIEDIIGKKFLDNFLLEGDKDNALIRCNRILNEGFETNCESHIVTSTG
ncbi:PAS domain-containing protein [Methanolobus sp. ZRKC4]